MTRKPIAETHPSLCLYCQGDNRQRTNALKTISREIQHCTVDKQILRQKLDELNKQFFLGADLNDEDIEWEE